MQGLPAGQTRHVTFALRLRVSRERVARSAVYEPVCASLRSGPSRRCVKRTIRSARIWRFRGLSRQADDLVGLQAEAPAGVLQAVLDREAGVRLSIRSVHRLQKEVAKGQALV